MDVPSLSGGPSVRLDDSMRRFVNFDVFYFSTPEERGRFDLDPVTHCGVLTDPVTYRRFRPHAASPTATHLGRLFYFESDVTHEQFAAEPDSFAVPRFRMAPKRPEGERT